MHRLDARNLLRKSLEIGNTTGRAWWGQSLTERGTGDILHDKHSGRERPFAFTLNEPLTLSFRPLPLSHLYLYASFTLNKPLPLTNPYP